jgi:glutamyl/glutaminyl-tRNA synthetase
MVMKMTHVIRGEDHLTNTACQAALYEMFDAPIPTFWHLPILCNAEGKKLSKRDFGFSLNDLIESGYLPEAINNYLATIGGGTFDQELLSLDDIIAKMNLDSIHSTGHVRYDVEKLRWLNHKWIDRLTPEELSKRCLPYLVKTFAHAHEDKQRVTKLLQMVKS